MILVTITDTPPSQLLMYLRRVLSLIQWRPTSQADSEEENRERRDFVLEMMQAHPDAFQNELDCQAMMHFYPSRF